MNSPHKFYENHSIFYEIIDAWLEGYYLGIFTMNNNHDILGMMDRVCNDLIFGIFCLLLLQFLLLIINEHLFASLEFHGWIHWHYEFT